MGLTALAMLYCAGQLCSLFFRSSILAAVFGLALAALLVSWAILMAGLEVPWSFAVLPLPAILLGVSWLRTADWLRERNRWPAWLKTGGVLALGLVLVVAAVCRYRALDIPEVDPGLALVPNVQSLTPEQKETVALYQKACETVVPFQEKQKVEDWVAANQPALTLVLEASRRPLVECPPKPAGEPSQRPFNLLGMLLESGRQLETQGESEEAAERYLAALWVARQVQLFPSFEYSGAANWAEMSVRNRLLTLVASQKLSASELPRLCRQVEEVFAVRPLDPVQLRMFYRRNEKVLADKQGLWRSLTYVCLPWEYRRAQRVLNVLTADVVRVQDAVQRAVLEGKPAAPVYNQTRTVEHFRLPERLIRSTPLLGDSAYITGDDTYQYLQNQTLRQATLVCLALAAWKAEHGSLPPTLDDLVGSYLKRMPLEPCSGKPFHYYREGLPQEVKVRPEWNSHVSRGESTGPYVVPAGTPLLWIGAWPGKVPWDPNNRSVAETMWGNAYEAGIVIP